MITTTDLKYALLALTDIEFTAVVYAAETERRRRFYADIRAKQFPLRLALWEKDVAKYGEAPYCREYEDGLDGFMIHTRECPHWVDGAVSSSACINFTRVR